MQLTLGIPGLSLQPLAKLFGLNAIGASKDHDNPLLSQFEKLEDRYSVEKTELAAKILLDCHNHTFGLPRAEQDKQIDATLKALIKGGFHAYRDDTKTAFTEFVAPGITGPANYMGFTHVCFAMGQMEHDRHLDHTKKRELEGLVKPAPQAHTGHRFDAH